MIVGMDVSRCLRISGLERPGHVVKKPESMAVQKVGTGG